MLLILLVLLVNAAAMLIRDATRRLYG
jgi:hypothetical protein